MKRYFIALGAAAFVGSAVIGSAAAIDNLDGGVIQSGAVEAACDDGNVTVVHRFEGDQNNFAYPVSTGANVSGIDAACGDGWITVAAFDANDDLLAKYAVQVANRTSLGSGWLSGNANVPVEDIEYTRVSFTS